MANFNDAQLAALTQAIRDLTEAAIARTDASEPVKFTRAMSEVLVGTIHAAARATLAAAEQHATNAVENVTRLHGQSLIAMENRIASLERKSNKGSR